MQRILCFGDSNTLGYVPGGGRYSPCNHYPNILSELLSME